MSMASKYTQDRPDDVVPDSMKAISPHFLEFWLSPKVGNNLLRNGEFVLIADASRITNDKRDVFCRDCRQWFGDRKLAIEATPLADDKKNDQYREIAFKVTSPDADTANQLASAMKALQDALLEQAEIDKHYVAKS